MDGFTFAQNIHVEGNVFRAPATGPNGKNWENNFLNIGAVDGLVIRNNTFQRESPRTNNSGADMVVYGSKHAKVSSNRCFDRHMIEVQCIQQNETTSEDAVS